MEKPKKCRRTVCQNPAEGFFHKDSRHDEYCEQCANAVNKACGQRFIMKPSEIEAHDKVMALARWLREHQPRSISPHVGMALLDVQKSVEAELAKPGYHDPLAVEQLQAFLKAIEEITVVSLIQQKVVIGTLEALVKEVK